MHIDQRAEIIYDFLKIIQNHLKEKTNWGRNQLMDDLRELALDYLNSKSIENKSTKSSYAPF